MESALLGLSQRPAEQEQTARLPPRTSDSWSSLLKAGFDRNGVLRNPRVAILAISSEADVARQIGGRLMMKHIVNAHLELQGAQRTWGPWKIVADIQIVIS